MYTNFRGRQHTTLKKEAIVAHFCAGEDLAHPESTLGASGPLPRGPKPRFLPRQLIAARAKVFHPHAVMDLDLPARRALFGLLAFYNLNDPNTPVFAFRETLMAEALVGSLATLYRGLKTLESKGYIERRQGRVRQGAEFGQYERSRVWLTVKARTLLDLRQEDLVRKEHSPIHPGSSRRVRPTSTLPDLYPQGPSSEMRDGIREKIQRTPEENSQPLTEEQPAPERPACPQAKPAGPQKNTLKAHRTVPGVPETLAFLATRNALSRSGIFKLMALAKVHGKAGQLEVVAQAAGATFTGLRGRAAFAYLATLLRQEKDFTAAARMREEDVRQLRAPDVVRAVANRIPAFGQRFEGCAVLRVNGECVGRITRTGSSYWVRGAHGVLPLNARTMREFDEGRLRVGQGAYDATALSALAQ